MNKEPFITPYVSFEIKDGVLYVTYLSGVIITLDIAKEIIKQRVEYTNGAAYPLLITYEGLRAFDKESRDYSAKEGVNGVLGAALLTKSVYAEFFGNFFLRLTETSISSKLFTDEQKALKWLEQFKHKS